MTLREWHERPSEYRDAHELRTDHGRVTLCTLTWNGRRHDRNTHVSEIEERQTVLTAMLAIGTTRRWGRASRGPSLDIAGGRNLAEPDHAGNATHTARMYYLSMADEYLCAEFAVDCGTAAQLALERNAQIWRHGRTARTAVCGSCDGLKRIETNSRHSPCLECNHSGKVHEPVPSPEIRRGARLVVFPSERAERSEQLEMMQEAA